MSNGICVRCGNSVWIRSMGSQIRPGQRQSILAILVSLIACGAVSSTTINLIAGVSSAAGDVALALSCYATLVFGFHLMQGLHLRRPATVRRWQALGLLCVTALSAWIVSLLHGKPLLRNIAAFAPGCFVAGLILGPWRGLLPRSGPSDRTRHAKEERNNDE